MDQKAPERVKYVIKHCNTKVNIFYDTKQKNRRLTSREFEEELIASKIWGHRPRTYLLDIPFYDNVPITPVIPKLNFDLNYKE